MTDVPLFSLVTGFQQLRDLQPKAQQRRRLPTRHLRRSAFSYASRPGPAARVALRHVRRRQSAPAAAVAAATARLAAACPTPPAAAGPADASR